MRILASIVVVALCASAEAAPQVAPPLGPVELYRAARAECGKPGLRIMQFMRAFFEHWLEPAAFGARVVKDWNRLSDEQRAKLEKAVDAKLLAPQRAREVAALCDKRDEYQTVRESVAGAVRYRHIMVTHHVGDDSFQIGWVLVEESGGWSLDRVEVPSMDSAASDGDPIDAQVRRQLGDYEHAMKFLGTERSREP
jgi:hypothetical protein